ncbi:hypothetical protein Pelo_600 [Pelomyxa schiedti]|nr:hypothetical protein Pelo_600 [Pelomyxa schiedti]
MTGGDENQCKLIVVIIRALEKILATDTETPSKLWASYYNNRLGNALYLLQSNGNQTVVSMATKLLAKYDPDKVGAEERMDTEMI